MARSITVAGGKHRQRRLSLVAGLALVGATAPTSVAGPATAPNHFASRPDLTPPLVNVTTPANGTEPGYILLAPHGPGAQSGPLMVDDTGRPVWSMPVGDGNRLFAMDTKEQVYQGNPVLTWWQGSPQVGYGSGQYVVMDQSYHQIATIRAGNGLDADFHDLVITPRNTAVLLAYRAVQRDRPIVEGVVQEVDIPTGKVLFEWHSLDHVGVEESTVPAPSSGPYDYFHINSVDLDSQGNLLVSARHTDTLYKVDRATGNIDWRLGGRHSDFAVPPEASFARQHDGRWRSNGEISVFDNASDAPGPPSRALVLAVDERAKSVRLRAGFANPDGATSVTQGDNQLFPDGHAFVGWGSQPSYSEFDATGKPILGADFGSSMQSYRAYRFAWHGQPTDAPTVAVQRGPDGRPTAYMSWNGATEVTTWRLLVGPVPNQLHPFADAGRDGFETAVPLPGADPYAAVQALDRSGNVLGTSPAVRTS